KVGSGNRLHGTLRSHHQVAALVGAPSNRVAFDRMDQVTSQSHPGAARPLLRRASAPGRDGLIVGVDPASAGWDYPDLAVCRLEPGQPVSRVADDRERLVLVLEGHAAVQTDEQN